MEVVLRLFGPLVLALQDQGVTVGASPAVHDTSIISLALNAGPVVLVVLATLLLFSAVSWGIIVFKRIQLTRATTQSRTFLQIFRKSSRFSEVQAACAGLSASPLVGLFQAAYAELNTQVRSGGDTKTPEGQAKPTLKSLDAIDRALLRATSTELTKLEQRIPFLATTASITPYIGLFGTVWGIMSSFIGIAAQGSTSLGVVAPGIAEALIATGAGLFAAIPAVYFYNDLTNDVKKFATAMDDFSMEFLTIAERNFT